MKRTKKEIFFITSLILIFILTFTGLFYLKFKQEQERRYELCKRVCETAPEGPSCEECEKYKK